MKTLMSVFAMFALSTALTGCPKKDAEKKEPAAAEKTTTTETKPAETKPAETKPAETKPAETSALPAECGEYKAVIEKLAGCDKLPQASRDALKQAFDTASASWATMPADAKANIATACKAGTDAVMQSAKAACGW